MYRLFDTHKVRKCRELSGDLWEFSTLPQEAGEQAVKMKVAVPSVWETYPDTVNYRGKACYEKSFRAGGNIRIECKGVSHTAQVYLDGEKLVEHYNAYTPFSAEAENLSQGEHILQIYADNSFGPESALHIPNDYQSYGGISRPVVLEELGEVYLTKLHFTPYKEQDKWLGDIVVELRNLADESFSGEVSLYLHEKLLTVLPAQIEGKSVMELHAEHLECREVKPWCPEHPALYTITALVMDESGREVDDFIDRVGFRSVEMQGRDILLNGRKIKIKGFCRHEDHPQFGCALPFEAMHQDILIMKDLGVNSVRTSHYPNDEIFLDLCDEMGILVWEENHARGLSEENMRNPNFERQCEDCIQEMIENHYNHPSIYIWGILNECASHTEYGKECYTRQLDLIRSLDTSRPRSFASCQFKKDICFGLPEVVSYNIYPKWYHDIPVEEYLNDIYDWVQQETEGAGKPFLITEIGAGAIYGYRSPAQVKWSEEYQMHTLEEQLKAVLSKEECSGVYLWQFCDCRVCDSWFHVRPRTMNNKGIVDEYRRPKLAYEVVKRIFTETDTYCS